MKAEMELTILEDGTISIQTGNMAGEHHASADEFIKLVHQLAALERAVRFGAYSANAVERTETPQAGSLLYKIIDARTQRSTALVTNIDFDAWGDYLGDPPSAMAFLDRVDDGAIILKIKGKSYRAHRAGKKADQAPRN